MIFFRHTVLPHYSRFQDSRYFDRTYLPRITRAACNHETRFIYFRSWTGKGQSFGEPEARCLRWEQGKWRVRHLFHRRTEKQVKKCWILWITYELFSQPFNSVRTTSNFETPELWPSYESGCYKDLKWAPKNYKSHKDSIFYICFSTVTAGSQK